MNRISALVIDQNRLFREGLSQLLRSSKFTVLGSAKTLEEASIEAGPEPLHLIICGFDNVIDIDEQFRLVSRTRTDSALPRVVVLTHVPDRQLLLKAAVAGFDAVLSKDISGEVLQRSLELVMLGQQVFPALVPSATIQAGTSQSSSALAPILTNVFGLHNGIEAAALSAPARPEPVLQVTSRLGVSGRLRMPLSEREDQILRRLAAGASNKMIARGLGITEGTVKVHVKSVCRKLGATNRTQAAILGGGIDNRSAEPAAESEPVLGL